MTTEFGKEERGTGNKLWSKEYIEHMKKFRKPVDIARENLGVKEMFDAPINTHWKRKVDEGMAYDEKIDNDMQCMSDEDISLTN
jgi:hypothetical protein